MTTILVLTPFLVSLPVSFLTTLILIPLLWKAGVIGRDMHKPGRPEVAEMGGLAIVAGFSAGVLLVLGEISFLHLLPEVDMIALLAVLATVLLTGLIGIVDDLIGMRQWVKAFLPVIAALPLMAVRVGHTWMKIPFFGQVNFWIFYPLVLVPLGVTGAANAVNMLAGFNGLEVGMGIIAMGSLSFIAASLNAATALVLLLAGLGALLGVIHFNWYPARVFVGDVGTLSIGAIMASAVIVGNFEAAGIIVFIPHIVDFVFKAATGFHKSFGDLHSDGKLHCPQPVPYGLGQAIMKLSGGISERNLVLILMGIEAVFGAVAIALYGRW